MKRFSLSRRERITRTEEFKSALHKSTFYGGKSLKIGISPNGLGLSRIGVSLRRQNFKFATQRNKLRRYTKEMFRLNKHRISKGFDIIVIPRASSLSLRFSALSEEFIAVSGKAGIIKKTNG